MVKFNGLRARNVLLLSIAVLMFFSGLIFPQAWRGKGRLRGIVLTEDGKPIANVKVVLEQVRYGATLEVTTDEKGRWTAANVRGGRWNIDFWAEGYELKKISTTVSEVLQSMPIEITLKKTEKAVVVDEVSALLGRGNELYNQKKYNDAIEEYQNILKENPELYVIHRNIGNCYYELEDYDSAIEHYEKVLEKEPDSEEILIALGNIYLEKGELETGLAYFERMNQEKITNPVTFYNIGTSFFNRGEMERAVQYYSKAIALDPNLSDAYYQLGLCYVNTNEKDKAKDNFHKFLEITPDSEKAETAKKLLELLEQ